VTRALAESPDVLVCKLIDNKITYVHRQLWPALVKLSRRFSKAQLAKVWEEHTESGAHQSKRMAFPEWVPSDVIKEAESLSITDAERLLSVLFPSGARSARASVNKR
jgi:ferritin-like metal-binding protein YciE